MVKSLIYQLAGQSVTVPVILETLLISCGENTAAVTC